MSKNSDFLPIEDYYIIGDLRTAALVSKQGSIDWLCLPYFDSPSIFGKLLDQAAGCLAIDMPDYKIEGHYVEDTAIVQFKITKANEELLLEDFMAPKATKTKVSQQLVRTISSINGNSIVQFRFQPKPKYATASPTIQVTGSQLKLSMAKATLVLHLPSNAKLRKRADYYQISIPIAAGDTEQLVLEYIPKDLSPIANKRNLRKETFKFWQQWVEKGDFFDFCHNSLVRSAITLKLMQFYPTGAMVAAPTTSLPEEIGGVRNWDYRYTWIRDATFTLYSLYVLGYDEEAEHFFNFIETVAEQCAEENFDISVMYTIWGEPVPPESAIISLSGYKNSSPVRIGNNATNQFQLDVYGSLIDAFYFASKRGLAESHKQKWRRLIMQLIRKIDELWQEPDHGIWEARNGTRHYTYSKVMAWVGADRAIRLAKALKLTTADLNTCIALKETIGQWIWDNGFKAGNMVQHAETESADATNFLFVLLQFLDKHDPLTRKIIGNTASELIFNKSFVYRYLKADGLPGEEGAFVLCSFWLISALAILEDVETALDLFKRLEKNINQQALLSEEIDPKTKQYLGNYPQAFSHMGYIMSVHYLNKYARRKGINI